MAIQQFTMRVHGLDCAEEVAVLEREVGPVVELSHVERPLHERRAPSASHAQRPALCRDDTHARAALMRWDHLEGRLT